VLHAECLWVHPQYRTIDTLRMLWRSVQAKAKLLGAKSIATAAMDHRTKRLLTYVGATKLQGEHYVIGMGETCQPQ